MGIFGNQLQLDNSLFIGKGKVREVFRHPQDANKCIKITFNKDRLRSVRREVRYLKRYHKLKKPFTHLPRFYGYCHTNKGKGTIFDLIRDFDGRRSTMLSDHIARKVKNPLAPKEIIRLLDELYHHLLDNCIIVCDPAPHNLLVHYPEKNKSRLVIVDGIGNPHFIKIAAFSTRHAHRIIRKKWAGYVGNNVTLKEIFAMTGSPQKQW